MMIFLNGPFGVGKTTTARLLVEKIPHARLHDPEHIGAFLRATLGKIERVNDYQDHRLWPRLTVEGARLLWVTSRRPLVIPMTIAQRERFEFITSRVRAISGDLLCVRLWDRVSAIVAQFAVAHLGVELDPHARTRLVLVGHDHDVHDASAGTLKQRGRRRASA